MAERNNTEKLPVEVEISDDDIYEAMKDIQGHLDITPADLKEVYKFAFRHAFRRITGSVRAKDIMTAQVFSVRRDAPLGDVAALMAEKNVSGIPVLDEDDRIAGIISEKDFLRHMGSTDMTHFMSVVAAYLKGKDCAPLPISSKRAGDIMTAPALTVEAETPAMEIAALFDANNINRVPVAGKDGKLAGIVSRADLVRALRMNIRTGPRGRS